MGWLIAIYVAAVSIHFLWLWGQAGYPLIVTDEVQYISVGENIRLGHGFTTRGEFHAGLPPLYPLFVAFAHSWGSNPRISALFFSCLCMCLAIFPAYRLARHIGLHGVTAYLMAAAAVFLPHTLFAGMYMTETLCYPLFLTAFWLFALWIEQPTFRRAGLAGVLLSLLLLTKVAAWSFAAAVLASLIVLAIYRPTSKPTPRLSQSACIFGLVFGTQFLWQLYKSMHQSAGLGMYGRVLGDSGFAKFSFSLLAVYVADFLLASGLVLPVPLFLWFRKHGRERFPLAVLLASTMAFQIAIHGVLEAGLTGGLMERLFLYSFPLMAMFAAKGVQDLRGSSLLTKILFIVVPLALLMPVGFSLGYNPVVNVPWASALGSLAWISVDSFSPHHLLLAGILAILCAGALILSTPRRYAQPVFAAVILLFYSLAFVSSAQEMHELSQRAGYPISPIIGFLNRHHVKAGDRLIICGNLAYYQEAHRTTPIDQFFLDWNRKMGLSDLTTLNIEAVGRYDVRMARNPEQIRGWMRPGDHLLTTTRFTDLELVGFQDPYYLYTFRRLFVSDPQPLYATDITAEEQMDKMLGEPKRLCPGRYRVAIYSAPNNSQPAFAEAVTLSDSVLLAKQEIDASGVTAFEFDAPDGAAVQFRLSGPSALGVGFKFAAIQYLHPYAKPTSYASPTGQFVTEPGARDLISSPELRLNCYFDSVNGEATAPMHIVDYGTPLRFTAFMSVPSSEAAGDKWVSLQAQGETYYLRAEHVRGDAFRAFAINPLPVGSYKLSAVQTEGNHIVSCMTYNHLTIVAGKNPLQR